MKQTIEYTEQNAAFVKEFDSELNMLCGMVEEMFVDEPRTLLSPTFRSLIAEKARKVKAMQSKLRHRLCVDNPGGGDL